MANKKKLPVSCESGLCHHTALSKIYKKIQLPIKKTISLPKRIIYKITKIFKKGWDEKYKKILRT